MALMSPVFLAAYQGGSSLYTISASAGFSDKDAGETATLDIANLVTKDADDNIIGTLTAQDIDVTLLILLTELSTTEHYNGTVYVTYDVTDGIANTVVSRHL